VTTPWDPEPGPVPPTGGDPDTSDLDDPTAETQVSSPPPWLTPPSPSNPPAPPVPPAPPAWISQPISQPANPPVAPGAPLVPPLAPFGSPPVPPVPPIGSYSPSWSAGAVPPTPPPVSPEREAKAPKGRGWLMAGAIVAAAALLTAGFLSRDLVDRTDKSTPTTLTGSDVSATTGPVTPVVPATGDEPVVAVAKALSPAVVQIQTQEGLGSGVIYDSKGLIVTNAHVVGTARTVQVNLSDGSKLQGTVQGADTSSDIAVVKIDGSSKKLTAAKLATTDPAVGSVAVAIGSPFGLSGSVTAGVVSAVDRPVDNQTTTVNMIQTDAPINPGNSGGALANRNAEVIGINAEIYSQKGENNGIGFAIPIQTAKSVADKITSGGSLARPLVGVSLKADPAGGSGVYLAEVQSGSPADKAGLQVGDLVTAIDGTQVNTPEDFRGNVGTHSPGDTITLEVQRNGQTSEVKVTLGANTGN
jgi:putative serine protease PepD